MRSYPPSISPFSSLSTSLVSTPCPLFSRLQVSFPPSPFVHPRVRSFIFIDSLLYIKILGGKILKHSWEVHQEEGPTYHLRWCLRFMISGALLSDLWRAPRPRRHSPPSTPEREREREKESESERSHQEMKLLRSSCLLLFLICSLEISVGQTTKPMVPATAKAPSPSAAAAPPSITTAMSKKGCKAFAKLLSSNADVMSTFKGVVGGGLTVFCPTDSSLAAFMPRYKNLTKEGKESLLLYHGVPIYNSMEMLKVSNGEFNTLATDGVTRNFNFTVQNDGNAVTLKSGVVTATIKATVVDKKPLAIYAVDAVLRPTELFKVVEPPAPAPAPAHKVTVDATSAPAPAGPEEAPADQMAEADTSGGLARLGPVGRWVSVPMAAVVSATLSIWI